MTRATIAGGAGAAVLVLLSVAVGYRVLDRHGHRAAARSPAIPPPASPAAAEARPTAAPHAAPEDRKGFLYGRITAVDGATYEGRLRWGGDQEAFWGDYFNGYKRENPWLADVPPVQRQVSRPLEIFGLEIAGRKRPLEVNRPLMVRFGDIARIEARGRDLQVALKSGTRLDLDRFDASDFDDGLRVWDGRSGVVDLDSRRIRSVELLPAAWKGDVPRRLHGTVRAEQGDFTGYLQWDRQECVGSDEFVGDAADGELRLRFDAIRAIARRSSDSSRVTLLDGREVVLARTREVGADNRGLYVDDARYGRVLVSWNAFERVDFGPPGESGSGPAYDDYPPGVPLTGSVATRDGHRLAGRLVYDLDESETTDTLDAPARGVTYTIPFDRIASIVPGSRDLPGARHDRVTLFDGEELQLESSGDLGDGNAGLLVFVEGQQRPAYVPWSDVERIDFDRPRSVAAPSGPR